MPRVIAARAEPARRLAARAAALPTPVAYAVAAAFQLLVFLPIAAARPLDPDEGVYALSAKLAAHGKLPYRDFLYPQMPLLPYVYGAWLRIAGTSWFALRTLSVLFAVGVGLLLFRHCRRWGLGAAVVAVVLYTVSSAVLGWMLVVKTYALSTLLLFAAFTLVGGGARRHWLWAGLLLGLAVDVRLLFVAVVPAFALTAFRGGGRLGSVARLAGGLALGLLPALVFLVLGPRRFWFDNLGSQSIRTSSGLVGDVGQKLHIVLSVLGLRAPEGVSGVQFLLLALAAVAAAAASLAVRRCLPLAFGIALLLALVSLLPTPTYVQYFCTLYPFLIVLAVGLGAELAARARQLGDRQLAAALALVAAVPLVLYVLAAPLDFYRYGPFAHASDNGIDLANRVTSIVDARTSPGEEVLSWWPGYLVGSHARPLVGTLPAPNEQAPVTPADARTYRLTLASELERTIRARRAPLIVYKQWLETTGARDWTPLIEQSGYRLVDTAGSARIYAR